MSGKAAIRPGRVEQDLRAYIRYLLSQLEDLYFEVAALKTIIDHIEMPGVGRLHLDVDQILERLRHSELRIDCHVRFASLRDEVEEQLDRRQGFCTEEEDERCRLPN